jgi:hypothetical protein
MIGDGLLNTGRYQWVLPDSVNSTDCRLRPTASEDGEYAHAVTPGSFTIAGQVGAAEGRGRSMHRLGPAPSPAGAVCR